MPQLPYPQGSPEWFEHRRGKITASIAAALLGLDPYTTAEKARAEIGGAVRDWNHAMRWGKKHEQDARAAYEAETGLVIEPSGFWVHDSLPWLGASPDGLVGDEGLVEVKCLAELPPEPPVHHAIQMTVQLAVTNREWCDYFVWRASGSRLWRVDRDRAFEGRLVTNLAAIYRQGFAGVAGSVAPVASVAPGSTSDMTPEALEEAAKAGSSVPAALALAALRVYGLRICDFLDNRATSITELRPEDLCGIAEQLRGRIRQRFPEVPAGDGI